MLNKLLLKSSLAVVSISLVLTGCNSLSSNHEDAAGAKSTVANKVSADIEFYVATYGADDNSGTKASPFKTLEGARNAIRKLDKNSREGDITVWLRGGTHTLAETFVLNRQDSGADGKVIRYKAYPNETPVLSSGKKITGWKKLRKPVKGLPSEAKGKVWVADVTRAEYGRFTALFTGDKRLPRAKSERFDGEKPTGYVIADSRNVMHKKDRHLLRKIVYKKGAPIRNWSNVDDIEVFFNPVPWALNFIPLESIDMDKRLLTLKYEANAPERSHH